MAEYSKKRGKGLKKQMGWIKNAGDFLVYLLLIAILPLLILISPNQNKTEEPPPDVEQSSKNREEELRSEEESISDLQQESDPAKIERVLIYDEATKTNLFVSCAEYMRYATACEMPALYEEEALKAQAVAAWTYVLYQTVNAKDPNQPVLTVNSANFTGFCKEEDLKKLWGNSYDKFAEKLDRVVNSVKGQWISYEGQPILAAYFASSAGKTEDSGNVWGRSLPYLKPVEIGADLSSKQYKQQFTFPSEELETRLNLAADGLAFPENKAEYFTDFIRSESETVLSVSVGGKVWTGQQIRHALSLPSAAFSVELQGDNFILTTHGYGHFVGFSQYGANELAKSGMSYDRILSYFYTHTALEKAKS